MLNIQFYYENQDSLDLVNKLADKLENVEIAPFFEHIPASTYLLLNDNDELVACVEGFTPFNLNEFYNEFIHKRNSILNKELLLSAINYSKLQNLENLTVLDMTGGLGRDSILFALAGFSITIVELNRFLIIILRYLNYRFSSIFNEMNVVYANSYDVLTGDNAKFDFIYYDPMFADSKHALAKKDMQIIDKVIELYSDSPSINLDNQQILRLALTKAHKFIVKRDNKQPNLVANIKPTYQKKGKTIRFDIYQGINKLPSE